MQAERAANCTKPEERETARSCRTLRWWSKKPTERHVNSAIRLGLAVAMATAKYFSAIAIAHGLKEFASIIALERVGRRFRASLKDSRKVTIEMYNRNHQPPEYFSDYGEMDAGNPLKTGRYGSSSLLVGQVHVSTFFAAFQIAELGTSQTRICASSIRTMLPMSR